MSNLSDNVTRPFPHAIGPGKSILSSMLQDPVQFIFRAMDENLTVEHFYMPAHQILFGILLEKHQSNEEIEFVSLTQKLLDTGKLGAIGGPSAITDLYTYAPSSGHFLHHLKIVKDKSILRQVINLAHEAEAAAYDAPDEAEQLVTDTERKIGLIADSVTGAAPALQECAQDLQITLIVLSQLNADGDTKHGRVIEEDADAVITIVQDRNKESETYKQHRHVLIAKDRHYGSGGERVPLVLDRKKIRFVHGTDVTTGAAQNLNLRDKRIVSPKSRRTGLPSAVQITALLCLFRAPRAMTANQ